MHFQNQDALYACVRQRLASQIETVEKLTGELNAEQRRQAREDGGWSIDQILIHLARVNETYGRKLEPFSAQAATNDGVASRWKSTLAGRALRWSVTTSRSVKTPRIFRPEVLEYEGDAVDAFLNSQRAILVLLDRLRSMTWSTLRCSSPLSSLVRLNAGDVFLILALHGDRHVKQLERQREEVLGTIAIR